MAFCPATVMADRVINPTDLILDESLVKWSNPRSKDSHFYYQKLWLKMNSEKKYLVFETPPFYSKHGLTKSMSNSDQLFVQLSESQRISLTVIDQFMMTNARFVDELEELWKKRMEKNPSLSVQEKFRAIHPGNSLYMKLHDEFEAFDTNYSLIDREELKAGYYRVLFHVSGFQYGEFSPSKPYLCGLSMKVVQVVYEARKGGICYLDSIPFSPPDLINEHESDPLINSFLKSIGHEQERAEEKKKRKSKRHVIDIDEDLTVMDSQADADDTDEIEEEEISKKSGKVKQRISTECLSYDDIPAMKKRKKIASKK